MRMRESKEMFVCTICLFVVIFKDFFSTLTRNIDATFAAVAISDRNGAAAAASAAANVFVIVSNN